MAYCILLSGYAARAQEAAEMPSARIKHFTCASGSLDSTTTLDSDSVLSSPACFTQDLDRSRKRLSQLSANFVRLQNITRVSVTLARSATRPRVAAILYKTCRRVGEPGSAFAARARSHPRFGSRGAGACPPPLAGRGAQRVEPGDALLPQEVPSRQPPSNLRVVTTTHTSHGIEGAAPRARMPPGSSAQAPSGRRCSSLAPLSDARSVRIRCSYPSAGAARIRSSLRSLLREPALNATECASMRPRTHAVAFGRIQSH